LCGDRPIIPFVIPKSTHMKVWLNEERTFPFYSVHNPLSLLRALESVHGASR
jgi:hypothetical protein